MTIMVRALERERSVLMLVLSGLTKGVAREREARRRWRETKDDHARAILVAAERELSAILIEAERVIRC